MRNEVYFIILKDSNNTYCNVSALIIFTVYVCV